MPEDNIIDLSGVPADLPEDVGVSYKPRSVFRPSSEISESAQGLHQLMDSQELALWNVAYQEQPGTPLPETNGAPSPSVGQRPAVVLNRLIGRGGFGEIWEATQRSLGRVIAVKRMREDLFDQSVASESTARHVELSFRQEALTAASLDHPNIVPIHDLGRDGQGRSLLSMKLVRGRHWEELLCVDRAEMDEAEFLARHLPILIQVCQAVAFAHSRGIVHRDLKPSQVMVGEFGEVLLMDWGLAVVFDPSKAAVDGSTFLESGLAPTLDVATSPAGTLSFMAPEQTDKTAARIGPWTDLYLLGGTLYYILTGTAPHSGGGNVQTFFRAMQGRVRPATERAPDRFIPAELNALCERALEPDPAARMHSAREFINSLQDYLTGASRRAEATELLNRAQEIYAGAASYEYYVRAAMMVEQATKLWPQNPASRKLQQEIVTSFARMALRNDDLILARLQTQRIADDVVRTNLQSEIEAREVIQADAKRQQAFFRRVAALAILVMLGTLAFHYLDISRSRAEVERVNQELNTNYQQLVLAERQLAQRNEELRRESIAASQARERAEELVAFLARDLSAELARTGRLQIIEKLVNPLASYYASPRERPDVQDRSSVRNRAMALLVEAFAARLRGEALAASRQLSEAQSLALLLIDGDAVGDDVLELLGAISYQMAETYLLLAEWDRAETEATRAIERYEELAARQPDRPIHRYNLAQAYYSRSAVEYFQGRLAEAEPIFENAERILVGLSREVQSDDPDDFAAQVLAALAMTYTARGVLMWERNTAEYGLLKLMEAQRVRDAVLEQEPWNLMVREHAAETDLLRALLLYHLGDYERGESLARASAQRIGDLVRIDGPTLTRRICEAKAIVVQAMLTKRLGRDAEADRLIVRAVELSSVMHTDAVLNQSARLAHATVLTAAVYTNPELPESRRWLEQARRIFDIDAPNLAAAAHREAVWSALNLLLLDDPGAAEALSMLARRDIRRREVYETALRKGLVEPSLDFEIRLKP